MVFLWAKAFLDERIQKDLGGGPEPIESFCKDVNIAAEAFTTTTSVVELYRPDGMLMKIHFTTDRFEELLRAFFKA